ncbi:MAG: hypothetical protein AB1791_13520 [Chloroflexota bacterium]
MDERALELLRSLPPLVACLVWDVLNEKVTPQTIELAGHATDDEWNRFDVVRCLAASNPHYPPALEAKALVEQIRLYRIGNRQDLQDLQETSRAAAHHDKRKSAFIRVHPRHQRPIFAGDFIMLILLILSKLLIPITSFEEATYLP